MDNNLLETLENKFTGVGSGDLYKRNIGTLIIWFSPLSYTDQAAVQEVLNSAASNPNALNDAKLVSLARSIVGVDDLDLRKYRNGTRVFNIPDRESGNTKTKKVDLAKYLEYKILAWGQDFVDLAFDVFADITESSKKKFAENVVFENIKEPRVELAELEVRVHELREKLGLPVLVEKTGTRYTRNDGELGEAEDFQEHPQDRLDSQTYSPTAGDENPAQEDEYLEEEIYESSQEMTSVPEPPVPVDDVLNSVTTPFVEEPVRSIPVAIPPVPERPIYNALNARRNVARPVSKVPVNAESSPDRPFVGTPSLNMSEVVDTKQSNTPKRVSVDPSVSNQSINPRFKSR